MKPLVSTAARLLFGGFSLFASLYCLLAYLPFTYQQIHAGHLFAWLDAFARLHPLLNLILLPFSLFLLIEPCKRGGLARWLALAFALVQFGLACTLVAHPVLNRLGNNSASLNWSLAMLLPVILLSGAEIAGQAGKIHWVEKPASRGASLFAMTCGALFVSLLYAAVLFLRHPQGFTAADKATGFGWSVLGHLVLFLGLYLVLECTAGVAAVFAYPARVEFWLFHLLLALGFATVLQMVVWPAVGFAGWQAAAVSASMGLTVAALNAAFASALMTNEPVHDGIAAALAPVTFGAARSWRWGWGALVMVGVIGAAVALRSAAMDWNYLGQKLTAAGIWVVSFGAFYTMGGPRRRSGNLAWVLVPLLLAGSYKGLEAAVPRTEPLLERWAGYDASFLLVRQFLTPPKHDEGSFYEFLNRNTNIAASVHVDPVPVVLTPEITRSQDPPHIFILTIDSLRRDYLSPYNPSVAFTPSIASFAGESTVFENAFTRYGGTGLSEPAIWSGALLLHKQYITPFAPMNALEKLAAAEQYQRFYSPDSILQTILTPSATAIALDAPDATMTLDFSRTLNRLQQEIERRKPDAAPIFAYTQPQNLHISVIQRQGASAPAGESYPGFYAPYASRVKRIDEAFGKFIAFLKQRGIYERSVIILTSDHGDSLGEEGRWGHAYTLFPEVVRIPLVIHLPENLRKTVSADPAALAFSTDITPSLYYLLGQRPMQKNELFGSPLFTETAAERQRDAQAHYLLASSYGAVYGILSHSGGRLYIADGVNYRNYQFDLNSSGAAPLPVNSQTEREENELIRKQILSIDRFYHFGEGQGGRS